MSWNESAMFAMFVSAALKSSMVLGVAWLTVVLLRRRSAAARHLVWTGAAAAIIALPLFTVALPALHLPVFLAPINTGLMFQTTVTASASAGATASAAASAGHATAAAAAWRPDWALYLMLAWSAGAALGLLQMLAAAIAI